MRLAYMAKAVSKRALKLDCGEDVFEADDMVKCEGGSMLFVEGRRQGKGDSHGRVCPCYRLALGLASHTRGQCGILVSQEPGIR